MCVSLTFSRIVQIIRNNVKTNFDNITTEILNSDNHEKENKLNNSCYALVAPDQVAYLIGDQPDR
ncbi:MAG: hypothetical protein LBB88_06275 [Planctomycetaceae bacterium]|nr:hypothetical protein [Planctomycetaceae bacterium]